MNDHATPTLAKLLLKEYQNYGIGTTFRRKMLTQRKQTGNPEK